MLKICPKCSELKSIEEFGVNKARSSGHHSYCKVCRQEYAKKWYRNNRQEHINRAARSRQKAVILAKDYVNNYKLMHPCVDCGYINIKALSFDHKPGSKKIDNVSNMVCKGFGIKTIQAEIDKCEVRCVNCHFIIEDARRNADK